MRNVNLHHVRAIGLLFAAAATLSAQNNGMINNDQVLVHMAHEKPHVKGKPHKHDMNRVMVYLQGGTQVFEEDGKKSTLKYKAGDVLWSPKTGMHTPELMTDTQVDIVEVELKQPGAGKKITTALDPLKVDPKHYKLEFQNDQVRVMRVNFPAHQGAPLHEHQLNRVVVYLKDQNVKMTTAEGKVDTVVHKPGEASWGEAVKHKEENLNDTPFEAIIVELL
jgi:uncharacterized RmlC-like cupin family protein